MAATYKEVMERAAAYDYEMLKIKFARELEMFLKEYMVRLDAADYEMGRFWVEYDGKKTGLGMFLCWYVHRELGWPKNKFELVESDESDEWIVFYTKRGYTTN